MLKMKKIFLLLVCLLIIGCKQEVSVEEEPVVEKPIILGVNLIEKTVHYHIVSAEPEGIFVVLNLEITNIGQENVILVPDDIILKDANNSYPVDSATAIYTKKQFPFEIVRTGDKTQRRKD